ncbi:MAG: sigma-70 family RNA polymerase sigma factor [Clostridia bacterium]|nr:sigma-70 family RNA polymerase sigma factor [Clostridia bacterium]
MKTNQAIQIMGTKEFVDKLFGFAYRRCNTSHEAEDLTSDIVLTVIKALNKQTEIENFNAFVWTVARRVYADHCDKRSKTPVTLSYENTDFSISSVDNEIDDFIEEEAAKELLSKTVREISFLAKIYRDVMVMFYLDELSVKQIAAKLGISENAVKQRLFSARNTVKKEVNNKMDRNLSLQPIDLYYMGTGNPVGNAPREVAQRLLSKNLVYLCRKKAMTAKEISDALNVPMVFIEEELNIQCHGSNGEYGMIRKLDNGKFIANIPVADIDEYNEANSVYEKHLDEICDAVRSGIEKYKSELLNFPYLTKQDDLSFILWPLIGFIVHPMQNKVTEKIKQKYFTDVEPAKRPYSQTAVVSDESTACGWGNDGISGKGILGYKSVAFSNMYGTLIDPHFRCGHNIANDEMLLMTVRAINGLDIDTLSDSDKEIAAKASECGYLRKNGNIIEPKIITFDRKDEGKWYSIPQKFIEDCEDLIDRIADELGVIVKKNLPEHLINDYHNYCNLIASSRFDAKFIDRCVELGILYKPEKRLSAEGMTLRIEK